MGLPFRSNHWKGQPLALAQEVMISAQELKDTILIELGPTLMTSLNSTICENAVSK